MNEKDNFLFHFSFSKTLIFFIFIFTILVVGSSLSLNINHAAIAEQQQQSLPFIKDISFDIDGVTFSHHMASVNGIQMHYVMGGKGDPVVLLHGFPQSWYEWRHIMPALAENYTVVVPDLRGFGDSSKPITGYDGKTTAEDIYQLVSQLDFNNQPIFLVAHDVGAQTAYSYAFAHPNNVTN